MKTHLPPSKLSKKRIRLFKTVLVLLPFFLLALIELVLRLFHYGHNISLFVPCGDNTGKLVMNPYASEKYSGDTLSPTHGLTEPFSPEKKIG